MKTVGIIGGLGPETTAKFISDLIAGCLKLGSNTRPAILSWNVPINLKIEEEIITKGIGEERILPLLIEAAKKLEKGDADFIVIPCNTVHLFIKQIRNSVKIPVLSIIEETCKHLNNQSVKRIEILATPLTVKSKLFDKLFSEQKIEIVLPSPKDQKTLGKIINDLVCGKEKEPDKKNFKEILNNFKKLGIDTVLLACTDLQLLNPQCKGIKIIDTLEILIDSTVKNILE